MNPGSHDFQRYHRQMLLPGIGPAGQQRLAAARVVLVGCGALGTTVADQLIRSGVGHLTVIDRDIVELTNLQRQTLFEEADAAQGLPKAIAAANRLARVNSSVTVVPRVADLHSGNIEDLIPTDAQLVIDGTDNVQTRYLVNDLSIKRGTPWIYGAAVGTEGRMMAIVPPDGPCLRCIFPTPPRPADLPTCDTAGVLGPGVSMVACAQAVEAIRILVGQPIEPSMLTLDFWPWRIREIATAGARVDDCVCCRQRRFEFLGAPPADSAITLCGRNAVQVRPTRKDPIDLGQLALRFRAAGEPVEQGPYFIRVRLSEGGITMTIFGDGRALIQGLTDLGRARSLYSRYIGL